MMCGARPERGDCRFVTVAVCQGETWSLGSSVVALMHKRIKEEEGGYVPVQGAGDSCYGTREGCYTLAHCQ